MSVRGRIPTEAKYNKRNDVREQVNNYVFLCKNHGLLM
jgi:hypothetical protein